MKWTFVDVPEDDLEWWRSAGELPNLILESGIKVPDARLVSPMFCEAYDCRAGSTDDTLGVAYVYSTEGTPDAGVARFLITNPVWREAEPFLTDVVNRFQIIDAVVRERNREQESGIDLVALDYGVLIPYGMMSAAELLEVRERLFGLMREDIHEE